MSASEKFQADLQQTKADFSELKSETERKVDDAKAKVGAQLATERAKDEAVFRAANEKDEAFYRKERDKDEAVFRAARADAKAGVEKLEAQRAQLKATIATKTGEARARMQAEIDAIDAAITAGDAAREAVMAKYFERRGAGELDLN
jgi:multidrug resistance efflux pump